MEHGDFKIGMTFSSPTSMWFCTDVGTRTIAAIKDRQESPDKSWMNGPPYAVQEAVFDENDFPACYPVSE